MRSFLMSAAIAATTLTALTAQPAHAREWVLCASENEWCELHGTYEIRYGARGAYTHRRMRVSGFMCNNARFGDPLVGVRKQCWFRY